MRPRSLASAALSVGAIYVVGSLIGFAQRVVVTSQFGAGAEYDAFNTAFRIPDLLYSLFASGALASAFIPVYMTHLAQDRRRDAWRLVRTVAALVFVVLSVFAVAAGALAPLLIRAVIAPGFSPAQVELTASLMRIMLVATVIFGVSGLLMGVLQSNGSFIAPALAPWLYNLGIIFGALALRGWGAYGLAAGVVIGASLHLTIQLPALVRVWRASRVAKDTESPDILNPQPPTRHAQYAIRNTYHSIPNLPAASSNLNADVRQIIRLMLPRMVGLGAVQINFIVNTNLASSMGEGAVSALTIAFAVMLLPQVAIAQAMATVLFPAISAHAARGERAEFARLVARAIGAVLMLSLPASIGLILLGQPLIRLLFERGAFDWQDTQAVSFALIWYGAGLAGHSVLEVVTRGFYALKDTTRPVILGVAGMALNVILSLWLTGVFRAAGVFPFGGLALANTIATAIETAVLLGLLAARVPELSVRRMLAAAGRSALAALGMGLGLWGWMTALGDGALATVLAVPAAVAAYFGLAWLVRSEEARDAIHYALHFARSKRFGPAEPG
ncbi:MAG: murein biosynthesis integral membrane protein MurJ [Anaerolineae bacterium]